MYIDVMKVNTEGGHPHLVPRYPSDVEKAQKMRQNIIYRANIRRPRNAKHHRKLMGMIRFVVKNKERWASVAQLLVSLKFELQLVDLVQGFDGHIREIPRSIDFDHMDQEEFDSTVYKPAVPLLAKEVGIEVWKFKDLFKKFDRE